MPEKRYRAESIPLAKELPMILQQCHDWSSLAGAKVTIYRQGQYIRTGIVDVVMPHVNTLWLRADHNGGRALFESSEGYEVRVDPIDLPDKLYTEIVCKTARTAADSG